jgi:cytochrome oxidase assembly protein ShyY1
MFGSVCRCRPIRRQIGSSVLPVVSSSKGRLAKIHGRALATSSSSGARSTTMSGKDKAGMAIFLGISAVTGCLGAWQMQRYFWKVDIVEKEKKALAAPPTVVPDNVKRQQEFVDWVNGLHGHRITLTGSFLHENEVRLGPRGAHGGVKGAGSSGMAVGPSGYYILTPFKLSNGLVPFQIF